MGGVKIDDDTWKDILNDCDENNDGKVPLLMLLMLLLLTTARYRSLSFIN